MLEKEEHTPDARKYYKLGHGKGEFNKTLYECIGEYYRSLD